MVISFNFIGSINLVTLPFIKTGYEADRYGINVFFIKKDLFNSFVNQDLSKIKYILN